VICSEWQCAAASCSVLQCVAVSLLIVIFGLISSCQIFCSLVSIFTATTHAQAHTHTRTHTHTRAHTHARAHIRTRAHTHADAHAHTHFPRKIFTNVLGNLPLTQHTATHYNTLYYNNLNQAAKDCHKLQHLAVRHTRWRRPTARATHCNATHCNTLKHATRRYNTLQDTATRYNTLQHTATH